MPTPSGRARPGDTYAIPLKPEHYAVVKVLYVSKLFRNVIGVAVASHLVTDTKEPVEYRSDAPLIYTAQACAQRQWQFLRSDPVTEGESARTLRIVAVDLYRNDVRLREATPEEQRGLPQMLVLGCRAVLLDLRRRFRLPPSQAI